MLPPPIDTNNSANELFESVQAFAKSQGYALNTHDPSNDISGYSIV
ncbi:21786_t:CDS:2 [Dentiscutata erythropus]|uniref:21786_t:CDS:1 n=1 Tax=Dentiscutata erythropus TaxID=1348616 RepID=A0A9N9NCC8_9GLOM|nr:21786_t:CDS:2 [Dentiscutata erythropus]